MDELLPPCPDQMQGAISHNRMVDPVVASDGFTYERIKIEKWFATGKRTSPMTNKEMDTRLTPNLVMKTRIQEWVEENTCLSGLREQLKALQGPLAMASTPKEAPVLRGDAVIGPPLPQSQNKAFLPSVLMRECSSSSTLIPFAIFCLFFCTLTKIAMYLQATSVSKATRDKSWFVVSSAGSGPDFGKKQVRFAILSASISAAEDIRQFLLAELGCLNGFALCLLYSKRPKTDYN